MKKSFICSAMIFAILALALSSIASAAKPERTTGRGTGPTIFVTSQGLYFDSIVVVDPLPQKGRFQQLVPTENGLTTEFGPGDVGHLGGRWWIDVNGDEIQNQIEGEEDMFFLCPLLGPGRENP
jgi:hypothetical protein